MIEEMREGRGHSAEALPSKERAPASLEKYLALDPHGPATIREIVLAPSITLQIIDSPAGPVLKIRAARIALEAEDTLELRAGTVRIESSGELAIAARRIETVATERSTTIDGADRLEAAVIETQASSGALSLRAQGGISLDGEHIGLNDDPCPRPFSWSRRAQELGHGE